MRHYRTYMELIANLPKQVFFALEPKEPDDDSDTFVLIFFGASRKMLFRVFSFLYRAGLIAKDGNIHRTTDDRRRHRFEVTFTLADARHNDIRDIIDIVELHMKQLQWGVRYFKNLDKMLNYGL